jgi:hypothetical protein
VDDTLLATLGGTTATWAPAQARAFTGRLTITDALAQWTYWLLAKIDATDAVAESDEDDNLLVADTVREMKWQFGSFDGRQKVALSVHDAAGALVVFTLGGLGWGEVQGGSAFTNTVIHDTTVASAVKITTRAQQTTLGDLTVLGHIKSVWAKAKLTGSVDVAGGIASLALLDVDPAVQSTISLHTDAGLAVDARLRATLSLGAVHDCSILAGDVPVRSLRVVGWLDEGAGNDVLQAPALDKLAVLSRKTNLKLGIEASDGDIQADLQVTGAVGSGGVARNVSGQWNVGSLGKLKVSGDLADCQMTLTRATDPANLKLLALGSLSVRGRIRDSRISSAGRVGAVSAGGMENVDVFNVDSLWSLKVGGDLANCQITLTRAIDPANLKIVTLGSLSVRGWIRDSRISSAGHVGAVSAGGMENVDVFAGVDPLPVAGLPDPATDLTADVYLRGLSVVGSVKTAEGYSTITLNVAAWNLMSVSLSYALAVNDPQRDWGLAYHLLGKYGYKDAATRYSWRPGGADAVPTQPGGDFTVLQA